MLAENEEVLLVREADQSRAQQAIAFEIEADAGFFTVKAPAFGVARRGVQTGKIDDIDREWRGRVDPLRRIAVPYEKICSQRLVTVDDCVEGRLQGRQRQRADQAQRPGDNVGRIAGGETVEEPL